NSTSPWNIMTWTLKEYCTKSNYTLAAIMEYRTIIGGNPSIVSYQWYFVSPYFLHSLEIIEGLSSLSSVEYFYRVF
ncbi:MAG: hypothetical protein ACFFDR_14095, partial [Candidatus Thorarchaeota archaeon]